LHAFGGDDVVSLLVFLFQIPFLFVFLLWTDYSSAGGLLLLSAEDSRGALLWAHQIEALYDLFEPQLSSAHFFRIYVSKKKAEAFKAEVLDEARGMIFPDGRSLADIVQERMIFGITKHLNARSASILMPHLIGRHESGRGA
jgi:hypothetical protein